MRNLPGFRTSFGQGLRPLHPAKRAGDARAGEGADRARAAQLPVAIRLTLCEAHQAGDQNGVQVQLPPRSRQSSKPPLGVSRARSSAHRRYSRRGSIPARRGGLGAGAGGGYYAGRRSFLRRKFAGFISRARSAAQRCYLCRSCSKAALRRRQLQPVRREYPQDPERPSAPQTGPRRPPSLARCFADI